MGGCVYLYSYPELFYNVLNLPEKNVGHYFLGLEQMMLTLPMNSRIAAIIGDQIYGPRVVDDGNNDNFWETVVFSSNMETISSAVSIKSAFQRLKNNLLDKFSTPNVVILTASNSQ